MPAKSTLTLAVLLGCATLAPVAPFAQTLPGTQTLELTGDLAERMIDDLDRFVTREVQASLERRKALWKPDYSSRQAYEVSVGGNRRRFRKIIGAVDERVPFDAPMLDVRIDRDTLVAAGAGYTVYAVPARAALSGASRR